VVEGAWGAKEASNVKSFRMFFGFADTESERSSASGRSCAFGMRGSGARGRLASAVDAGHAEPPTCVTSRKHQEIRPFTPPTSHPRGWPEQRECCCAACDQSIPPAQQQARATGRHRPRRLAGRSFSPARARQGMRRAGSCWRGEGHDWRLRRSRATRRRSLEPMKAGRCARPTVSVLRVQLQREFWWRSGSAQRQRADFAILPRKEIYTRYPLISAKAIIRSSFSIFFGGLLPLFASFGRTIRYQRSRLSSTFRYAGLIKA